MAKAIAVSRQDPIEVYINASGDVVLQQERMGETETVFFAPENAERLILAIRTAIEESGD